MGTIVVRVECLASALSAAGCRARRVQHVPVNRLANLFNHCNTQRSGCTIITCKFSIIIHKSVRVRVFTVYEPENCTAIAAAAEISTDVTVQLQFMKDTSPIDGKCSNIAATFTMVPVPHTMWRLLTSLALLAVVVPGADGGYPNAAAKPLLAEVKGMFDHGYEGYLKQVFVCVLYIVRTTTTSSSSSLFFNPSPIHPSFFL